MAFMQNSSGGGDFTPFVKYNAKAGRWYTKKDEQDAPEFEVTNLTAIFDMDSLRTGWFLFAPGVAPDKVLDPSLTQSIARPSDLHKSGFQLNLFSEKNLLGKREFSSTAGIVIEAMNALHTAWELECGKNPGKLPVVKCTGVSEVKGKHGSNYMPNFEIISWADRPAELGGGAAEPAAKTAPPPAKQPEPAAAGADEPDF